MYILIKSGQNGVNDFTEISQDVCHSHLYMLAWAFDYVSRGFMKRRLRTFSKLAQLTYYNFPSCTIVGEITPYELRDNYGTIFSLRHLHEGFFYLENYLKDENGIQKFVGRRNISPKYNGLGLLRMALIYMNGYLSSSISSKYTKVSYLYDANGLLYTITTKGIYDKDNKLILDFGKFYVNNGIPKRKRKHDYRI